MQHIIYMQHTQHILKRANIKNRNEKTANWEDSLDQNPPEAAKAGAVRHFARVRYSHFLSVRARAPLLSKSLPFSSSLVAVSSSSMDDLVPHTVGVSGGDAAHSRTCGRTADIISLILYLICKKPFKNIPEDRHRDLSDRLWWAYHQEAHVTREWTKPADRTDRLSTDWAPLDGRWDQWRTGPRLCATSTWEPGM